MAVPHFDDRSVIDLTTTGRVTGEPHRIEIWFAQEGSRLYLLAGGGDRADWVRNVRHDGRVVVHAGDLDLAGLARVVHDADEATRAKDTIVAKYQPGYGGDLSRWRDRSLPVAVELDQP
jgi:deazaflavin-dependent oxidoreductase (nitroreductase family)